MLDLCEDVMAEELDGLILFIMLTAALNDSVICTNRGAAYGLMGMAIVKNRAIAQNH